MGNHGYVPIVFLTSLQDPESLAKCLDSGGDDFLSKPYNRVILKAKIKAFGRMRLMHEKLQAHNRQMLIEHFNPAERDFPNDITFCEPRMRIRLTGDRAAVQCLFFKLSVSKCSISKFQIPYVQFAGFQISDCSMFEVLFCQISIFPVFLVVIHFHKFFF